MCVYMLIIWIFYFTFLATYLLFSSLYWRIDKLVFADAPLVCCFSVSVNNEKQVDREDEVWYVFASC